MFMPGLFYCLKKNFGDIYNLHTFGYQITFKRFFMTYQVTYTSKMQKTSFITVRGRSEKEAINNAAHLCHTGTNFRDPLVIENNLYTKPRKQGFAGKN